MSLRNKLAAAAVVVSSVAVMAPAGASATIAKGAGSSGFKNISPTTPLHQICGVQVSYYRLNPSGQLTATVRATNGYCQVQSAIWSLGAITPAKNGFGLQGWGNPVQATTAGDSGASPAITVGVRVPSNPAAGTQSVAVFL